MNEVPTPNYCYYQLAADDKWTSGSAEKLVLVKAAGSNSILFGKQCKKAPASDQAAASLTPTLPEALPIPISLSSLLHVPSDISSQKA